MEEQALREKLCKGTRKLLRVMDTIITLILMVVSGAYTHVKMYQIAHLNFVWFIAYNLYFNNAIKNANFEGFLLPLLALREYLPKQTILAKSKNA